MENRFWTTFYRNIDYDNCQGTIYRGPQGILTIIVQIIWTIIWDQSGRYKQTFQKTAVFTMKEVFGPFILVLSSVTNLKGLFLGVHKLFWQLLWKLLEHFLGPERLLKTQTFEKKRQSSQWRKQFGHLFLISSNKQKSGNNL